MTEEQATWEADGRRLSPRNPLPPILWIFLALLVGVAVAKAGAVGMVGLLILPLAGIGALLVYRHPIIGIHITIAFGFTGSFIKRYLQISGGLAIDGILLVLVLVVAFRKGRHGNWDELKHPFSALLVVWIAYCFLQLLNPEAVSTTAWIFAARGIAFYLALYYLANIIIERKEQVYQLIATWLFLAAFSACWGIKQILIGVSAVEARWLARGAEVTHVIFGKLRAFSIMSDCAQFGISMAYAAFFAGTLCFAPIRWRWRVAAGIVALLCFYGLVLSGTRSAMIAIPIALGGYMLASRRWSVIIPGAMVGLLILFVMRYTMIGQSNYDVARMRQAFRPMEDPSFLVRLENQKKLKAYLATRPFGGGIGSAGYWGLRFSPDTFLAQLALDSWYVKIAAETGAVGLALHLIVLLYCAWVGFINHGRIEDKTFQAVYRGFYGSYCGIIVASYSNQYLGQMPTGVLVYLMFSIFVSGPRLGSVEVIDVESTD